MMVDQSAASQSQPVNDVQMQAESVEAFESNVASAGQAQPEGQKPSGWSKVKSLFSFGGASKAEAKPVPQMRAASNERSRSREMDRNLSCEEMDSDDLGGDLNLSDQEDGAEMRSMNRVVQQSRRARGAAKKQNKYAQEYDTNVFEVGFDCLANKGVVATGDAEICAKCGAVFNQTSKLSEHGE